MNCNRCGHSLGPDDVFCPRCGAQAEVLSLASLDARLNTLQARIGSTERSEQRIVEIETTEMVVSRVMKWTKMFLFFAAVPAALVLIFLGVLVGRKIENVNDLADAARARVDVALQQANQAVEKSAEVSRGISEVKSKVDSLDKEINTRRSELNAFGTEIAAERQQTQSLTKSLSEEIAALDNVKREMKDYATARSIQDVKEAYPVFGKRMAIDRRGRGLAKANKPAGFRLVDIVAEIPQRLKDADAVQERLATVESKLNTHKYSVIWGEIALVATSGLVTQGMGSLNSNLCVNSGSAPPCVIYFQKDGKDGANEVARIVSMGQRIDAEHILQGDFNKLGPNIRELVDLSGVDMVVVLGGEIQ